MLALHLHALAEGHAVCEPHCRESCAVLNGNVENECGACASEEYLCRRGQPGFSWRERRSFKPRVLSGGAVDAAMAESLPPLDAFDEQHGCRIEAIDEAACEDWDPEELPAQPTLGRAYCVHALCLGRMLAANGAPVTPQHLIRAPMRFMGHQYFPLRLSAAELFTSLCAQLSTTHLLEGAGCLASAANATESHDIAIRWMGLEAMERLLQLNNTAALGWAATAGRPTWDEYGSPGGTLDRGHALREMGSRLEHWQPGTRWMATHGVGAFAPKDSLQLLDGLVKALQGDMGFPGIGLHATEVMANVFSGGKHEEKVLGKLAALLSNAHDASSRGSSETLVRLLAIHAARLVATDEDNDRLTMAFEKRAKHKDASVRVSAFLALYAINTPSESAAMLAMSTMIRDTDKLVRCAARKVFEALTGESSSLVGGDGSEANSCASADWSAERGAYLKVSADENAPMRTPQEAAAVHVQRLVHAPERALERLAVASPSEEAALLCMLYLSSEAHGNRTEGWSQHEQGMRQRVRWRALLTLPLVLPRDGPPSHAVRDAALRMMGSEEVNDRYLGMKALMAVVDEGDLGAIKSLANAMHDWVDVIKLQAGEHLVQLAPRTQPGLMNAAEELITVMIEHDMYTRFAGVVALRKLAAATCEDPQIISDVIASVVGQLHAGPSSSEGVPSPSLARAADTVRALLRRCGQGAGMQQAEVRPDGSSSSVNDSPTPRVRDRRGVVGATHCFSLMRELPEHVQQQAYDTFQATKNCNLTDTSQVRSRGVLLVPSVMESADLEPNEVYLKELMANASEGTQGVKRFHGRSTFRGGKMNSAHLIDEVNPRLLDKLDRMLGEWNKKGYTPLLPWLESENATAPKTNTPLQVREIEHVVINPDEHDCPYGTTDGIPCGCDWHVDGGMKGYKIWVPMSKEQLPNAREKTNVLVVPMDNAQRLCELAGRLNASAAAAESGSDAASARVEEEHVWSQRDDSKFGTAGEWVLEEVADVKSKVSDRRALEAASCVVEADVGDLLLFYPGVYHRTQDAELHRVSFIAEATHS